MICFVFYLFIITCFLVMQHKTIEVCERKFFECPTGFEPVLLIYDFLFVVYHCFSTAQMGLFCLGQVSGVFQVVK